MSLLNVENLTMHYRTRKGDVTAIDGVSFCLNAGTSLGLVGESGCGKTSVAMSLLRLLPENAQITHGKIEFAGKNLLALPENQMRNVRWQGIAMIFQAAMNAFNPVYKVGDQIIEVIQTHTPAVNRQEARQQVERLFAMVGLPANRLDHYPHQYSGGMKQRAMIAMALACNPQLIIADEPTTALDVIVQNNILQELEAMRHRLQMSIIYISHDIAMIAQVADYLGVMYAGQLVEYGPSAAIFAAPNHPYTAGLIAATPSIRGEKKVLQTIAGEPPDLLNPPTGCCFHPRCPYATTKCGKQKPPYIQLPAGDNVNDACYVACWRALGGDNIA